MTSRVEHVAGRTCHRRLGQVNNRFAYGVDYVLLDPETPFSPGPALFGRNRWGLFSLSDRDHGGPPGKGQGAPWARAILEAASVHGPRLRLLAQPRVLGHVFNPVSFWLAFDDDERLVAAIAEVTNTFGDRHSYLCMHEDRRPIGPVDEVAAEKILHVSPFQPVAGHYRFRFDIRPERIAIRIDYRHGEGGVVATLAGPRKPLTTSGMLAALVRRPMGARRVLTLIHWQALKLWLKRSGYRRRPAPPATEISR